MTLPSPYILELVRKTHPRVTRRQVWWLTLHAQTALRQTPSYLHEVVWARLLLQPGVLGSPPPRLPRGPVVLPSRIEAPPELAPEAYASAIGSARAGRPGGGPRVRPPASSG